MIDNGGAQHGDRRGAGKTGGMYVGIAQPRAVMVEDERTSATVGGGIWQLSA
jgi:hypothetical protein